MLYEHLNEHLNEHIERQNAIDLESGIAPEGSGTLKLHYEISKDQLDNLIKLRVNNQIENNFKKRQKRKRGTCKLKIN